MKIRVKFEKTDHMRFVGHLDILRYFQKAMRRAHIPIKYSEGFSPHQIMSFGAPLSMGVQGLGEYMDIELKEGERVTSAYGIDALNSVMCDGMHVLSFLEIADDEKNAMSAMTSADFMVVFKKSIEEELLLQVVESLLSRKEIFIEKQSKKKEKKGFKKKKDIEEPEIKLVDIRPLIKKVWVEKRVVDGSEVTTLCMHISQGSVDNLKPELVLGVLCEDEAFARIYANGYYLYRCEMYNEKGQSLEACGRIIL